ncbi:MAG: hypothetical protein RI958_1268 [Actinomycetota bacterium]|jgi:uncharacterized membrane protein YfcA
MSNDLAPSPVESGWRSVPLARTIIVGLVAGFLSGLFGVGGGILIVPALVIVLKFDQRLAHGTSLAAVLPIALSSMTSYAVADKIDWRVALFLAIGALAGAVLGTHFLHKLPHDVLALGFSILLVATAVRMLVDNSEATGRGAISVLGAIVLVGVGFATGILAGLLGVGGGIILVPAMVIGVGIPAAIAKGTSLAVIVPTSIMGTWRNRKKRNADLYTAAILGVAGIVSAYAAGALSVGMSESLSNLLFALLLLFVAARMLFDLAKTRRSAASAA